MLVTGGSIYRGSSEITEVYRGETLVWSNGISAPEWPGNYFLPAATEFNGMSFWKDSLTSGHTYSINATRDDMEGEGGGGSTFITPASGTGQMVFERSQTTSVIPNKDYQNAWVGIYDDYQIRFNSLGDFDGGTAIAFRSEPSSFSTGCFYASTGINWDNVELAVNLISPENNAHNSRFADLVILCPNLKYICVGEGRNTGSTIALTGSTAWTADSMKFTEWYCPGTTFIVQDNSWWRSRIDWDIAEVRNVTFMDTNSNIMTGS